MDQNLILDIVFLAILVCFSGFFSGSEVALVGVSKAKVNQLIKEKTRGSS